MHRSDSYDANFSKRMRKPEFAQEYILSLVEDSDEPMTVEEALRFTISRMGTSDFAEIIGEKVQTVDKFLKGERNPKPETLDKFLRPFGLKTKVGVTKLRAA
jgi:DNA-binding phage protein